MIRRNLILIPLLLLAVPADAQDFAPSVNVSVRIVDDQDQPVPCNVYLKDDRGNPVQPKGLPYWRDHFTCDGTATISLAEGRYSYIIERGPEFAAAKGTWNVTSSPAQPLTATLHRLYDLAAEGWYSGELHIHRPVGQVPLLLQASDLDVGPVITWWNRQNPWTQPPASTLQRTEDGRFYDLMGGEDERGGGALLYFGLTRPIEITSAEREYPASTIYLREATEAKATDTSRRIHVDVEKPFWRDVPLWLASERADTMGIAHNHLWRSGVLENEAWGRARDASRWPPPHGNGLWSQFIYFQALNCGFRIPPSAGSASGVLPNPVGYNRCYVKLDGPLDYFAWWEGLRAGRVFVTNGPLLTIKANDELPGHQFSATAGPQRITVTGLLRSADSIAKLEVIWNGDVIKELPLTESAEQEINVNFECQGPGWFVIRAVTNKEATLRFAMTGPFYVEGADQPRPLIRESAEFFLDWSRERRDELARLLKGSERDEVVAEHDKAVSFWEQKVAAGR